MKSVDWWKNFALGMELDAAGTFVYNGVRALHGLPSLNHPVDCFEVLYNLSVGIERLLKVAIILVEHEEQVSLEQLERSLISHNTIELADRINSRRKLELANVHREFLSVLSRFYKTHRYGRYSISNIPEIDEERKLLLRFICKHGNIQMDIGDEFSLIPNSDKIRRFFGTVVKKICDEVFRVVKDRARELNIFTYEIRSDSKAMKVFYGERLDFLDEDIKKKELLLFLMSEKAKGVHRAIFQEVDALDLDPTMVASYIHALVNDVHLPYVEGEIDELYMEMRDVKGRLGILRVIDNEHLSFDDEGET
ncbi:hypothetical protein [Ectothiorhodospira variabilis]|uniref:hypothetical protein n=1 Tax=Ectothiorhodospira variabilis TaxID=505694 RepID=UPI001EFA3E15|nr:hypothetical protein [Ectothiorhodospira variabilis]MCG5498647.1 hypothetical protein [Ectothiorhodospira variabilis]